jgi:prepilin-type N-terminal cleavage/methylation domain-containing protein
MEHDMTHTMTTRIVGRRRGFTLIELLAVIVIIGILVSIGVAIGMKTLGGTAEQNTQGAQEMAVNAIMRYHELTGEFPDNNESDTLTNDRNTRQMVSDLMSNIETKKMLAGELADYIRKIDDTTYAFIDDWDNEMRFTSNGVGGTPALISAGPDGDFDTHEDNLRSDAGQ